MFSVTLFPILSLAFLGVFCVTFLFILSVTFFFIFSFTLLLRNLLTFLLWNRFIPGNLNCMALLSWLIVHLSVKNSITLFFILSSALCFIRGHLVWHLNCMTLLSGFIPTSI